MRERDFIDKISKIHRNHVWDSDAEVVPAPDCIGNELFSMDSFSEKEDFLTGLTPWQMGRQMACMAVSDILVCGTTPQFMLQNWRYDKKHDMDFYLEIAKGIESVLSFYMTRCVGGDTELGEEWGWTSTMIGYSEDYPVIRGALPREDFDLFASDLMGTANAAIFCGKTIPLLKPGIPVPQESLFATDTSGGFMDALENFRRINYGMHLEVDADSLISPKVHKMLPKDAEPAWTLVGGVGEYELVFALPAGSTCEKAIKIGSGYFSDSKRDDDNNEFIINYKGKRGIMTEPPPDYRDIDPKDWVDATATYWKSLFK